MKNNFSKILSIILILASLISCLTVFIYAEESDFDSSDETVDINSIELLYKRNFEEGWEYTNGFKAIANHKAYVDFEENSFYKYNYFWRIESSASASTGYSTFDFGTSVARNSGTVVQFKIKADDACELGKILYMTTAASKTIDLLYIRNGALYAFQSGNRAFKICDLSNNWITLTFCFDWDATKTTEDGGTDTLFKCRLYHGDEGAYIDYEANYSESQDKGMKTLGFGIGTKDSANEGMSYCIDDLQIYQKTKVPVDLSNDTRYGVKINDVAEKTIVIEEGPGKKSTEQIINEALCMKVGVSSALMRNKRASISNYCTPQIVKCEDGEDRVMIPLMLLLDFIGYPYYPHPDNQSYDITTGTSATYITIGRDTATVDGQRVELSVAPGYLENDNGEKVPVIAAQDIQNIFPGWLLTYDDMGLIIIYQGEASENGESLITRDNDLDLMLTIMKKFVFDVVTEDESGKEIDDVDLSYIATGEKVMDDVKANTELAHPYLIADQAKFDSLKALYSATENADATAQAYLAGIIENADAIYSSYADIDAETGAYIGIKAGKEPVNLYGDGNNPDKGNPEDKTVADTDDGYSPFGTLEEIETYTEQLVKLAFAYQITGEDKYARLAYDISVVLGTWTHWGPGYVINCAVATGNFALAYDWLYNFYFETYGQEAVDALASTLYNKGVKHGYTSSSGALCEFPRNLGGNDTYVGLTNNWNAACSSGMIIGALALVGYEDYADASAYLIGNNIRNLINNGLDQYAPDGSYAESALLWAEGTNGFVKLIMALESATGSTYGFDDTWGLDKTFYFACYIEDSDGKIWNYHEGGADGFITGEILGIDTQMFFYAGQFLNDSTLVSIRKNQIEKGKEISIFDILFYPTDHTDGDVELSLDYHMEGIDAFVSRSDWEDGALYTGIMGGANDIYGGQIDSGNFIYRNKGITWFMDLGSDNPDVYGYYGAYRYRHYRNNAEGQNVVILTSEGALASLPYGQDEKANGKITSTFVNEHGSYAILNNTSAYGSLVSYANRGILVTDDRNTVVIQDEVSFKKIQEATWVAHTYADVEIDSTNKRVAYLRSRDADGNPVTLRATIVSNVAYEWETMNADANGILEQTYTAKDSVNNGGGEEYSRKGITRLVINSGEVLIFNVAIVLEIMGEGAPEEAAYNWTNMINWEPGEEGAQVGSTVITRDNARKTDIQDKVVLIELLIKQNSNAYTTSITGIYEALTLIAYTLKTFKPDSADFDSYLIDYYGTYLDYKGEYDDYIGDINDSIELIGGFAEALAGIAEE